MLRLACASAGLAAALLCAAPAGSASPITAADAMQLLAAAGMSFSGKPPHGQVLNPCGHPTAPQVRFIDLSGDGRAEAVTMDHDPACYGSDPGYQSKVLTKTATGHWQVVAVLPGAFQPLPSRSHGWVDFTSANGSCRPVFRWNGHAYAAAPGCGNASVAQGAPAAAEPVTEADAAPSQPGVPGTSQSLTLFPATYGRFAPGGDCARLPRVTIAADAIRLETAAGGARFPRPNVLTDYTGTGDRSITYQLQGEGAGLAMSVERDRLWTSGGDDLGAAERALDAVSNVDRTPLKRCR